MLKVREKNILLKSALLATIIPLSFLPRHAQAAISIIVSGTQDLHFGTMTESGAGGTMTVNTAGARVAGGAVTGINGGVPSTNGVLSVAGSTGVAIDLTMTAATFTVTGAGAPMNVNNFNLVTNAGGAHQTVTLATNPTEYPLGARLNIGAGQVAGTYVGFYTVNANYQ